MRRRARAPASSRCAGAADGGGLASLPMWLVVAVALLWLCSVGVLATTHSHLSVSASASGSGGSGGSSGSGGSGGSSVNVGTWVQQSPTALPAADQALAQYHVNGQPPTSCDHVTFDIGNGLLMSSFGSSDNDPNTFFTLRDLWLLDTRATPPAWHVREQANAMPTPPRTAPAAAYHARSHSLLLFGGWSYPNGDAEENNLLLDDVLRFDLNTNTWHHLQTPSPDFNSNAGPGARAWTDLSHADERTAVPGGGGGSSGSGTSVPATLVMFGGTGTLDGAVTGLHAHDLDDTWALDADAATATTGATLTWTGARGTGACVRYRTQCVDAASYFARYPLLQALVTNLTAAGTNATTRPADLPAAAQRLVYLTDALRAAVNDSVSDWAGNATRTANSDAPDACVQMCALYDSESAYLDPNAAMPTAQWTRPALVDGVPRRLEGARLRCVDGRVCFMFGGYTCNFNGQNTFGGSSCFSNRMYVLHLTAAVAGVSVGEWTVLEPPTDVTHSQYALWPTPRAFHSANLVGRRIWYFGGSYLDSAGSTFYYNDWSVWNVDTRLWEPVTVFGAAKPPQRWSHTMTAAVSGGANDTLWLFGGCAPPFATYNDLWTFHIGLRVTADNVYAYGGGLNRTTAGALSWFLLAARASHRVRTNSTHNHSSSSVVVFDLTDDGMLSWGSGLAASSLTVQVVGTFAGRATLETGAVTDLGGGLYNATYTVTQGTTVNVHVQLDGAEVPNSPFSVQLLPSSPNAQFASAMGNGLLGSVVGETSSFTVFGADSYGNALTTGGQSDRVSVWFVDSSDDPRALVTDNGDGTYQVQYTPPPRSGAFDLRVEIDGTPVPGSPFRVVAYTNPDVSAGLVIASYVLTSAGIVLLIAMAAAIFYYRNERAMKAGSPIFMGLMLLGGMLALASIFLLSKRSDWQCAAFPFVFGAGFMCLIASLFAKTWRVSQIFNRRQLQKVALSDARISVFTVLAVALDAAYNALWYGVAPLRLNPTARTSADGFSHIAECDSENFELWSLVSYVFHGVILLYGVFLASNTSSVPNAFNESRYLAVVLYNSGFSALAIPILYAFNGEPTSMFVTKFVAIEYAVLFACVALAGPRIYFCRFPHAEEQHYFVTHAPPGAAGGNVLHSAAGGGHPMSPASRMDGSSGDVQMLKRAVRAFVGGSGTPSAGARALPPKGPASYRYVVSKSNAVKGGIGGTGSARSSLSGGAGVAGGLISPPKSPPGSTRRATGVGVGAAGAAATSLPSDSNAVAVGGGGGGTMGRLRSPVGVGGMFSPPPSRLSGSGPESGHADGPTALLSAGGGTMRDAHFTSPHRRGSASALSHHHARAPSDLTAAAGGGGSGGGTTHIIHHHTHLHHHVHASTSSSASAIGTSASLLSAQLPTVRESDSPMPPPLAPLQAPASLAPMSLASPGHPLITLLPSTSPTDSAGGSGGPSPGAVGRSPPLYASDLKQKGAAVPGRTAAASATAAFEPAQQHPLAMQPQSVSSSPTAPAAPSAATDAAKASAARGAGAAATAVPVVTDLSSARDSGDVYGADAVGLGTLLMPPSGRGGGGGGGGGGSHTPDTRNSTSTSRNAP